MAHPQPPPPTTTRPTRIRHRRSVCVLAATSTVLLLGACSANGAGGAPTTTVRPTATTAPVDPEPDPSPWTALPTVKHGPNKGEHTGAVLASSVAQTPEEQAAVEAYLAYWSYFVKVGYQVKVDRVKARKLARERALDRFSNQVTGLRKRGARTVGWASIHVDKVWIGEYGILVWACVDNGTRDVDKASGAELGTSPVAYDAIGGVRRIDDKLVVTSFRIPPRSTACAP